MSSPPAIRPMVLLSFREPFSDPDWLFEVKHDGFRALAYVVDGDCRLVSRKNHVYRSFGPLSESIATVLEGRDAVIDGEIVCLGPDGRSLFKHLMYKRGEPYFYAFDLLWLDGEDLREWPLIERKKMLRMIVPARLSPLLYVDHVVGRGKDMFKLVCDQDLEGVVAKWKRGKYMADDRTSWGEDQESQIQPDHRTGQDVREEERLMTICEVIEANYSGDETGQKDLEGICEEADCRTAPGEGPESGAGAVWETRRGNLGRKEGVEACHRLALGLTFRRRRRKIFWTN